MERDEVFSYLAKHRYGVVSSMAVGGQPQSALVGIAVSSSLEVVFDTLRTTRKYCNLAANPKCSVVVGWQDEQTVQLDGLARELTVDDHALRDVYFQTWTDGRDRLAWPGLTHFVVTPTWMRFSDYRGPQPEIQEWTMD
jgi:pyridoxine/pyridoxamine 5'-phosphate oxidase